MKIKHRLSAAVILLMLCASGSVPAAPDTTDRQEWNFRAYLDDRPIGYHRFVLQHDDRQRILESEARFDVEFLLFKVYEYAHRAEERWTGNCLQAIDARTDDNGELLKLEGTRQASFFVVATPAGRSDLPACVMSFAYWNPAILDQSRLLNPQTGEYEPVEVDYLGREGRVVAGRSLVADRYRIRTGEQRITLWYAADSRYWLGLESLVDGKYTLRYVPDESMTPPGSVPLAEG
jgi:hypothetical protein